VGIVSVKLIDNEAFYGYRVRRAVNGELYQEYFSLKQNGKRFSARQSRLVGKEAYRRDDELAEAQHKSKQSRKSELCFNRDGSVKGISYLMKREKSGNLTPIFQIGIASDLEEKIICTSFSLNAHGKSGAWRKAVEAYAKHKSIRKNTKLYKKLVCSMPRVRVS
jgi:hypothetical protein